MIADGVFNQPLGFNRRQLVLGLALELRVGDEYGQNRTRAADHVVAISGSLIFDSNHSRALPLTCASFNLCVDMDHTGVKCDGIARAMRLVPTKKMKKLLKLPNSAPVADAKPASFDDLVSGISALSVV